MSEKQQVGEYLAPQVKVVEISLESRGVICTSTQVGDPWSTNTEENW